MNRAGRRFAVKRTVGLCPRDGGRPASGLMIELSSYGCRLSKLGNRDFAQGDEVTVNVTDETELTGFIRWTHDGLAGVGFKRALPAAELSQLLEVSRS
ncbi:hypothetical protein FHS61_001843 [Altererythrobacter atlanticus]|uniref:Uncharacterized protein n=1 Tax=Croceibacterium atlanticum TaxID=1267766 RepID=A0A0F7KQB5_9SPHN|nr:PilZ domain-containing protein [Croceibacterium atlanticum]AKH41316.1 hypothetical protein WYH_00252 [Croceibacterium atlanticum]MBB5732834.1 hypothetical protein [Croceibacterium atlanticum]